MRRNWSGALILLALALAGCAIDPKTLPAADRVCLTFVGLSEAELSFLLPRARVRLRERAGMTLVSEGCHVRAKYTRLTLVTGSTPTLFFSLGLRTQPLLGEDGLLTITPAGATEEGEVITVSLRGADTATDSLRDLAYEVVDQTRKRYRSTVGPQ